MPLLPKPVFGVAICKNEKIGWSKLRDSSVVLVLCNTTAVRRRSTATSMCPSSRLRADERQLRSSLAVRAILPQYCRFKSEAPPKTAPSRHGHEIKSKVEGVGVVLNAVVGGVGEWGGSLIITADIIIVLDNVQREALLRGGYITRHARAARAARTLLVWPRSVNIIPS